MWFAVTRGTGVWVGARHVWPNAHADRYPDPSRPERMPERNAPSAAHERCACPKGGSVPPPWLTSDATDVQSIRTSTHAWPYGLFAPLALALEVDAVLTICDAQPTMVVTSPAAMMSSTCVAAECATCSLAQKVVRCGPGESTCGPSATPASLAAATQWAADRIALRSGATASRVCACDEASPTLNCGVG